VLAGSSAARQHPTLFVRQVQARPQAAPEPA